MTMNNTDGTGEWIDVDLEADSPEVDEAVDLTLDPAEVDAEYATKGDYSSGKKLRGKKTVYEPAVSNGITNRVRMLNMLGQVDSPVRDAISANRPPLADKEMTMDQVHARQKEDSPLAISLFTGGGGMFTGFAMSGWRNIVAGEFVNDACETLAANYPMHVIWPTAVLEAATTAAEELGIEVLAPAPRVAADLTELTNLTPALVVEKPSKRYQQDIGRSVAWENTMFRCGVDLFIQLRERTNELVYANLGEYNPEVTYLWGDDVRAMSATEMLKFMNIPVGAVDCVLGGPPCASFSIAGTRLEGWGKQHKYSEERVQSTRTLFDEYVRLVGEIRPKTFIAENVTGLISGPEPRKYTSDIIQALTDKGYICEARVLNAADYECVQARRRLFIQGVRNDLRNKHTGRQARPAWPVKSLNDYVLRDALDAAAPRNTPELVEEVMLRGLEIGRTWDILEIGATPANKQHASYKAHPDAHCQTLTVAGIRDLSAAGILHPTERRKFTVPEIMAIFGYPTDYIFPGKREQASERMGRSVPPIFGKAISAAMRRNLANCTWNEDITADASVI